jgi:hypothetical protein
LHGCAIGKTPQIAFQIDDDSRAQIDALSPAKNRV